MTTQPSTLKPYRIAVTDAVLVDLRERLPRTRWPTSLDDVGWDDGADSAVLRPLADYWANGFDWRVQEAALNQYPQFEAEIDGQQLHFLHIPAQGPHPIPLLMLHGWPSCFTQMLAIAPLLTQPDANGLCFELVIPSLPGFGFSSPARQRGMHALRMAELINTLMTQVLGFARYAARGSDVGRTVLMQLALRAPERLIGLHLTGLPPRLPELLPADLSAPELAYLDTVRAWHREEFAYAMLQSSKPQTLAHALNDSPVGLMAWILEKFRRWSDCGGELSRRFSRDELLTLLTIYWATSSITSSVQVYREMLLQPGLSGRAEVPTAMLMSSQDIVPAPRAWVERSMRLDRWTEVQRGGHFLEWEEPQLVANDLRAFFGDRA